MDLNGVVRHFPHFNLNMYYRNGILNKTRVVLITGMLLFFSYTSSDGRNPESDLQVSDESSRYLLVRLDEISFGRNIPLDDSLDKQFYSKAFNQLLIEELGKQHINVVVDTSDPTNCPRNNDSVATLIRKNNCTRLICPLSCVLQKNIFQKKGWRDDRFGPSYERPEKTVVSAKISFSVYNSDGNLHYRKDVEGKSNKPFLYHVLKKFSNKNTVTQYARSLYSPPGLKAMYKAIKSFCAAQPPAAD